MDSNKHTSASGNPYFDFENSQPTDVRGAVLRDFILHENLAHAVRERLPERIVSAKGSGAYGKFTVTHDITAYTKAKIFSKTGSSCRIFARFSTFGSERGSADTVRDSRGFAIKFYTDEGNWDLAGSNAPVFVINDPAKFPAYVHTQKRQPKTNLKSVTAMWDFASLYPESLHQTMMLMSDRGTPFGYRHMHGFGAHTFSMVNIDNERVWVKFHFRTKQGIKNFSGQEALKTAGENPDFAQEDLYNAIEAGSFPKWTVYIQVMTEEEAKTFRWNPFDVTKVWFQDDFPLLEVGEMELNEIPENYFNHVEQAVFAPGNLIRGIGLSPDRILQARLFTYSDAQRYRVGANAAHLEVNRCPFVANKQSDDGLEGAEQISKPAFQSARSPQLNPSHQNLEQELEVNNPAKYRRNENEDDHYTQPGLLYTRALNTAERESLVNNIVASMKLITGERRNEIINRQLCHFFRANIELGMRIAAGLEVEIDAAMFTHGKEGFAL